MYNFKGIKIAVLTENSIMADSGRSPVLEQPIDSKESEIDQEPVSNSSPPVGTNSGKNKNKNRRK
jgi:hypothetical protein